MAKRYTRQEFIDRLWTTVKAGKPLVMTGAGNGIAAKFIEQGGIDILGVYNTGYFRMQGYGSLAGAVVSMGVLLLIKYKYATSIHFMLHAAIGLGVCVVVGYLTSLLLPFGGKSTQGLTIHTMPPSDE